MTTILSSSPLMFFFSFVLLQHCFHSCICEAEQKIKPEMNGIFVFGSSLVDNGNNNFLDTTAKADYSPYGIDYPKGPSGRFTNGKNVIGGLSELLKLPHPIPAFFHPMAKGKNIVHGVNFASGGSGILNNTGSISGHVISLSQQIENFKGVTMLDLSVQLGCNNKESLHRALSNYLFIVACGGNDYVLNKFQPRNILKGGGLVYFTMKLIAELSERIKGLYSLGARKFMLLSVYPMGCIPAVKEKFYVKHGCFEPLNVVSLLFNSQMKALVKSLKPQMPGSSIVYVNSYKIIKDIIRNPSSKGFSNADDACCELTTKTEDGNGVSCKRDGSICDDRNNYVFFDGLHTSEAINVLIAHEAYSSNDFSIAYPFNIQQLAKL